MNESNPFSPVTRFVFNRSTTDPENYSLNRLGSAVNYQQLPLRSEPSEINWYSAASPSPLPSMSPLSSYPLLTPSRQEFPFPNFPIIRNEEFLPSVSNSPLSLLTLATVLSDFPIAAYHPSSPTESHSSNSTTSSNDLPITYPASPTTPTTKGRGAKPFDPVALRVLTSSWNSGSYYPNDEKVQALMNETGLEKDQVKGWFGNKRHRCKGNEITQVGKAQRAANIAVPRTQTRGKK